MASKQEMAAIFDQPQEAVRINDYLVDPDTGEIISEHDIGIDKLVLDLKDGQEQEKGWAQHNTLLKLAIGKKLDDANVRAAETPYAVARWMVQQRPSAHFAKLDEIQEQFGLVDEELSALYECGRDFDVKKLRALRDRMVKQGDADNRPLVAAIDALIEEKTVSFVLLQPLRKLAPRLERETVED